MLPHFHRKKGDNLRLSLTWVYYLYLHITTQIIKKIFLNKRYKNTPSKNKQERTTDIRRILLYMPHLGETSLQLEKELRNFFQKYRKEFAQLSLIHRTHSIGDHFKYKDKQAHLERCNVVYKLKCSCGNSYIGQTQRNLKFRLEEHNPLKSNHQNTDVVKHLYSHPDHFVDFKNPEILSSAFQHREKLISFKHRSKTSSVDDVSIKTKS